MTTAIVRFDGTSEFVSHGEILGTDPVTISISLKKIDRFMLAAEPSRVLPPDYVSKQDDLTYTRTLMPAELISSAAEQAIECTVWLFKHFGLQNPSIDAIRTEQQKLLTRQI